MGFVSFSVEHLTSDYIIMRAASVCPHLLKLKHTKLTPALQEIIPSECRAWSPIPFDPDEFFFIIQNPDEVFLCRKFRLTGLNWLQAIKKPDIHSQVLISLISRTNLPSVYYGSIFHLLDHWKDDQPTPFHTLSPPRWLEPAVIVAETRGWMTDDIKSRLWHRTSLPIRMLKRHTVKDGFDGGIKWWALCVGGVWGMCAVPDISFWSPSSPHTASRLSLTPHT